MLVGALERIFRFPTKSQRWERLERVAVGADGLDGDRVSALVVRSGHAREGKTYRGKENDRLHLTERPDAAADLAAQRGVDVEVRRGERFFDAAPVSILLDRWLNGLNAHVGYAVEPIRFRPNFFVRSVPSFALEEEEMTGWDLALGAARLRVRCPIERCVVTTYDPDGGVSDAQILRYVAQARKTFMGIYCDVLEPGVVRAGDSLDRV
jgi:uncharacterized protein